MYLLLLLDYTQILSIDGVEVRDYKHENVIRLFQDKESLNLIVLPSIYRDVSYLEVTCMQWDIQRTYICIYTDTYTVFFNVNI